MREKIAVDQEKIKEMLASGMKPYSIGIKLKIPRSVPDRILAKKDVPYYYKKPIRDKSKLCSACGLEPRMHGHRYLGIKCFHGNSDEGERRGQI